MKCSFYNDYSEGAHPRLLDLLRSKNMDQEEGYGNDRLCRQAAELLRKSIDNPDAAVHFISGGTQANLIALAAILKPYESAIAAHTAHILMHEAGAIEATGHKIHSVPSEDGKLTPMQIQEVVDQHTDEHMVKPRAVFVSHSTEVGTVYKKRELEAISEVCRRNGLYLYLDGARLGSALTSQACDLTLAELAHLVDLFYVGGTKNGALLGEAMILNHPAIQPDFRYYMKQHGALLAKSRVMGSQFVGLFQDGLFFDLARHANHMASWMAKAIRDQGFEFLAPQETNQIFPILPDEIISRLQRDYGFYIWANAREGHKCIRLVTSWATQEAQVKEFIEDLVAAVKIL